MAVAAERSANCEFGQPQKTDTHTRSPPLRHLLTCEAIDHSGRPRRLTPYGGRP